MGGVLMDKQSLISQRKALLRAVWVLMDKQSLISQRKALLRAVWVLMDNGHPELAQQLWEDASRPLDKRRRKYGKTE